MFFNGQSYSITIKLIRMYFSVAPILIVLVFTAVGSPDAIRSSYASLRSSQDLQDAPSISSNIRIIGGIEASPHQFPYQVAIQTRNYYGGYDLFCGGIIYDSLHIITAAHCVYGIHPRNLKVIGGEHQIFNDEGTEQYRDVSQYEYHPNFIDITNENDIAIITLDWPLDLNDNVQSLPVPFTKPQKPAIARTMGWGLDDVSDEKRQKLMYTDVNIYSRDDCVKAYERVQQITAGMMCAGDEVSGTGSCTGDSGGPLICTDAENKSYLCGIVSWGMIPCGLPQYPTVFTDINFYAGWLRDKLPPINS